MIFPGSPNLSVTKPGPTALLDRSLPFYFGFISSAKTSPLAFPLLICWYPGQETMSAHFPLVFWWQRTHVPSQIFLLFSECVLVWLWGQACLHHFASFIQQLFSTHRTRPGSLFWWGVGAGCVPKLLLQNSELCAFGMWTVCSEDFTEGDHWAGELPSNTLSLLSSLCHHASVLIQQNLSCVKKASPAAVASCTVSLSTLFLSTQLLSWCVLIFSSHIAQLLYSHRCSCESLLFILSSWYKLLPF